MSYLAKQTLTERAEEPIYEIYDVELVKDVKDTEVQIPRLRSKITVPQLLAQKESFQKQINEIDNMLASIQKIKK